MNSSIEKVYAREILDSRGNPTIEVDITTKSGHLGRAAVPSGASTGQYEALELRDMDKSRYCGKGVQKAIKNVNSIIAPQLMGFDATEQSDLDSLLIELDGTQNKSSLGANALLGVSLAAAHAGSNASNKPLYSYLGESGSKLLPIPLMNILNGGSHADNSIDIQEFMICPLDAGSFSNALKIGAEIFHMLKSLLKKKSFITSVGDEGGFAPNLRSNEEAIEIILESIIKSGLKPGQEVSLALDIAASELYEKEYYNLYSEKKKLSTNEMIEYLANLVKDYPIISIEDGLDENDWNGWAQLTKKLGNKVQVVGDDLTVTNIEKLKKAIDKNCINAILIKLNQIGTLTETMNTVSMAKNAGFGVIISHRSGETEDTTIADLAVAVGMGQIKTGSLSRTDRICKYNQLLRIEEELGVGAKLAEVNVFGNYQ